MRDRVKIYIFLNATKVVKINNQNPQFKVQIRMRILSGSKNWSDSDFGLPSLSLHILMTSKIKKLNCFFLPGTV